MIIIKIYDHIYNKCIPVSNLEEIVSYKVKIQPIYS